MSETLTLEPRKYDKLGVLHCGVVREGRVTVAGEIADIADGQELEMPRGRVKVRRQGEEYIFEKAS